MHKLLHYGAAALAAALSIVSTSCASEDPLPTTEVNRITFNFNTADFTSTGEWKNCYNPSYDASLKYGTLTFERSASATVYEGVTYRSWKGFTPSMSTDNTNHSGDWVTYQWGCVPAIAASGNGFMLACWDSQEKLTAEPDNAIPLNPSVKIGSSQPFRPASISITNACYTYYTMLEGDDFCKKFTADDWLLLVINGVRYDKIVGQIPVYLAFDGRAMTSWQDINLSSLGIVDYIYFQMASSDTGQWGMNTPGYFCLGNMTTIKD